MLNKHLTSRSILNKRFGSSIGHSREVNDETFESFVHKGSKSHPVIVDFSAKWCGPCQQLGPILEKSCKEKGVEMCVYDMDESSEMAELYGVKSIPQVFVFSNGKIISKFVGSLPEDKIESFVAAAKTLDGKNGNAE